MFNIAEWLPCPHCKAKPYKLNENTVAIRHSAYCPDFLCDRYPATDEAQQDYNDNGIRADQTRKSKLKLQQLFADIDQVYREIESPDEIDAAIHDIMSQAAYDLIPRETTDFVLLPVYENAKPGSLKVFECQKCGWQMYMLLAGQRVCPSCGRELCHPGHVFSRKELEEVENGELIL